MFETHRNIELMPAWPLFTQIKYSFTVAKLPLCILVAFSAMFGHIYGQQHADETSVYLFLAVLLLACGGASCNSYQERREDRLMRRTRERPLVKRKISNRYVVIQAILLITSGLFGILAVSNMKAFIAGVFGIAVYNLVYTRMKSRSFNAIVPGSICGAIPPYIGWLAANGSPVSLQAALVILLLVFWQIPHFFLVMLNHKEDYFQSISPNMLKYFQEPALQRIFMPWITALAATMIAFTVVPLPLGISGRYVILGNTVVLLLIFVYQLFFANVPKYKLLFRLLNFSLFLFMFTVCFGLI